MPIYKHDCDGCKFICTQTIDSKQVDIYICASKEDRKWDTWLARRSDEGSDYWSMDYYTIKRAVVNEPHTTTKLMQELYYTAYDYYQKV